MSARPMPIPPPDVTVWKRLRKRDIDELAGASNTTHVPKRWHLPVKWHLAHTAEPNHYGPMAGPVCCQANESQWMEFLFWSLACEDVVFVLTSRAGRAH
jgi:hypothetical protein